MWPDKDYQYPTRETYRYHFIEPPAAPLQHEETKRVRKIMQWDRSPLRKPLELEPMASERTELDYQMVPDLVNKDAPFGTDDTSTITMKLIGGNYWPVIEKHPKYKNEYAGSRIQSLKPIADKPNHVDPRIHGEQAGGYYNKDAQPTNTVNKRPDSKDFVRGQFKGLPPVQLNRHLNAISTVFEQEQWTSNKNPSLSNDTEYKQNFFQGRDLDTGMDTSQPQPNVAKDFHFVSESENKNLSMLLPSNVLIPVDSIKLTREQETTLCKKICNELNRFDPSELRNVYVECSQHDKELRGFCAMDILDNTLRRHKAFLSDTLRLIGAQFVDPNHPGKVNYEKTLSFIGSALQLNEKGQLRNRDSSNQRSNSHSSSTLKSPRDQGLSPLPKQDIVADNDAEKRRSQDKQPKYYMQNGESLQTRSIYKDREVAKLLRLVEQELTMNNYTMNWTRWHNCFCERDRDHRETLSAAQIKDICYDQRLPLSDSIVNQVLNLCDSNNRDGQYRWLPFIEFLNRVCPSNTGLPIPVSKRPLEYAKHLPDPVPNWPRAEADTERKGTQSPRRESPRRGGNPSEDRGQTPFRIIPTPNENYEMREEDNRLVHSPDRHRSRDRTPHRHPTPHQDRSPLPPLRINSPAPTEKSISPSPRDKHKHAVQRYQPDMHSVYGDNDHFNNQDRGRYFDDRYDYEEENRPPRRDFYEERKFYNVQDRRRSYAEEPSVYQPSWQQQYPKRSTSPPPPRRINERDNHRREEREHRALQRVPSSYNRRISYAERPREPTVLQRVPSRYNRPISYAEPPRYEDSQYEQHWKRWAKKSKREPRELQRVPSRYNRPKSYAEPPRKSSFPKVEDKRRRPYSFKDDPRLPGQYFERSQSPVKALGRNQSISPVRQMSPEKEHFYPSYREPYAEAPHINFYREQYPYEYMDGQDDRYTDRDNYQQRNGNYTDRDNSQQRDGRNFYRDGHAGGGGDASPRGVNREQQINQLSQQLRDLETKYEVTRDGIRCNDKPWLERYLILAKALYNSDISNKGSLPRKDVLDLVYQYNNSFNLNIDMTRANMLVISPGNMDKSGNIILRAFLANLSADRITYKA